MDRIAIKNFAIRARHKLITAISQKAHELEITKDEIKLVENIKEKGFDQLIEEVAYTWFNRLIVLRFMEVNEYLPSGVRFLSSIEEGKTEPDIIKAALNIDFGLYNEEYQETVYKLIDTNNTEDLYRYLLVNQCNQLEQIMPEVFEKISYYTELLIPDDLLGENSVIRDLVESIDEEDYKDKVEIIGWLYQYYISEKKDQVFADLKKGIKISKENIPAATQLFTPKWIVQYMIENSLGRLWLESSRKNSDKELQSNFNKEIQLNKELQSNKELQLNWKYYLEDTKQKAGTQKQIQKLIKPNLKPEDIKVLDPSCGSGHILVYAFDVLYDIYLQANYPEGDIPKLILENNLYGLDIDDRAGQLTSFALMMKGRSKYKGIFKSNIKLNICVVQESNGITDDIIEFFAHGDLGCKNDIKYLVETFHDAKEYGSILNVNPVDFGAIEHQIKELKSKETSDILELQYKDIILEKLPPLIQQARIMSGKYDVVCTNPPYMGKKNLNPSLSTYMDTNYPLGKSELYSAFILKCIDYTKNAGFTSMITIHTWMFITSFKDLRKYILDETTIISMLHTGPATFDDLNAFNVLATSFCLGKTRIKSYNSHFVRLADYYKTGDKILNYHNTDNKFFLEQEEFFLMPSNPVVYWVSETVRDVFKKSRPLKDYSSPKQGLATGNNNKFVRYWFEVSKENIYLKAKNSQEALESGAKWLPYNKGGNFRKWYGMNEYIVNWENDGFEIKNLKDKNGKLKSRPQNTGYYFKAGITWSLFGFENFGVRYKDYGYVFDVSGSSIFPSEDLLFYVLAFLSSKVAFMYLSIMAPTVNFQVGNIGDLPLLIDDKYKNELEILAKDNIKISREDWDEFEESWDFERHPFLKYKSTYNNIESNRFKKTIKPINLTSSTSSAYISDVFKEWERYSTKRYNKLRENEERINEIFIEIYHLENDLTPDVVNRDIALRKADRERDVKSFISYGVACMFGRYSLDEDGLVYAGGEFDNNCYKTFIPTTDNILVIADNNYFEDDIVSRFVDFIRISFGEETLEENLDYIAESLGQKTSETARQTIRRYFLKDFYKDHVKSYKKRPIYWLFDSGRQNGFKALIYIHRYDPDTVSRVRTDYLHKLQKIYEAEVARTDLYLENDVIRSREKATRIKKKESLNKKIKECMDYEQIIANVANQKIEIDLDDGIKENYNKFQGIEISRNEGKKPQVYNLLSKI